MLRTLPKLEETPAYFAVDKVHWGVIIPLEPIFPGKPGLWRYGMAIPDEKMTAEEAQDPKYVEELLLRYIDGPRPVEHTVVRSRLYRLHQLLASTMHRGRVLLAGDAAHVNSPVGGLGLCTGLLDVDILSQALDLILNHDYHDPQDLLAEYSAARRFVFQNFINPTSTANKLRLHESDPDNAAQEDWFLRMVRKGDRQEIANALAPLQRVWRTELRSITKEPTAPDRNLSANLWGILNIVTKFNPLSCGPHRGTKIGVWLKYPRYIIGIWSFITIQMLWQRWVIGAQKKIGNRLRPAIGSRVRFE